MEGVKLNKKQLNVRKQKKIGNPESSQIVGVWAVYGAKRFVEHHFSLE